MSTRTVAAVAAVIAAAIIGGAVIWAVSDDESAREAALESPTRTAASSHTVKMPEQNGGQPIGVDNFSIGASRAAPAVGTTKQSPLVYAPLEFARPLDALSLQFFQAAAHAASQGTAELTVNGVSSTGKPAMLMRYQLGSAFFAHGDDTAPGTKPTNGTQAIGLDYATLQLQVTPEMQYAPSTDSVGWLEIPNVAEVPGKPAYLRGVSWGWTSETEAEFHESRRFRLSSITIERQLDRHAPWFWQALANGAVTPQMTVRLRGLDSSGKPVDYMTYVLSNVLVTSVRDSGAAELRQQIKLDFAKIELQSEGQKAQYDLQAALG